MSGRRIALTSSHDVQSVAPKEHNLQSDVGKKRWRFRHSWWVKWQPYAWAGFSCVSKRKSLIFANFNCQNCKSVFFWKLTLAMGWSSVVGFRLIFYHCRIGKSGPGFILFLQVWAYPDSQSFWPGRAEFFFRQITCDIVHLFYRNFWNLLWFI